MNADPDTPRSPLGQALRVAKAVAVFLVVAWHLAYFAIRNPLDLWKKQIRSYLEQKAGWQEGGERAFEIADEATHLFDNLAGCEQRWLMFSPAMARGSGFLATRYEFSDGSEATVFSDNEPEPTRFFRVGGWQTRKLEDCLFEVPSESGSEFPIWAAFVRAKARAWKENHPADPRELARLVLLKRFLKFPCWDEPAGVYGEPEETVLATFDPNGRLVR